MKPGDGVVLEISVKEFRVEMANPSFGLPNVIAYGRVQAAVKSGDGGEPASRDFKIAHYGRHAKPVRPGPRVRTILVIGRAPWGNKGRGGAPQTFNP